MSTRSQKISDLHWPEPTRLWTAGRFSDAVDGSESGRPDVEAPGAVLVLCDGDGAAALEAVREIRRTGAVAVFVHAPADSAMIVEAVRAGASDILAFDAAPEEWGALRDRLADRLHAQRDRRDLARERAETTERLRRHRHDLQQRLDATGEDLARAHDELTRHTRQLSLLYQFGRELSTARNWDDTLARLLENLSGFVGADGAAIVLRPAPDAPFAPRQTWQWGDSTWDRVLLHLEEAHAARRDDAGAGIFQLSSEDRQNRRVTALPLEHMDIGFGYLLLLGLDESETSGDLHAFLRAVQVILAEEVAAAQMLDRMRELSIFNARVLETVQSGIWVVDEQARTIYCNRIAREMLSGRSHEAEPLAEPRPGVGRGRSAARSSAGAEFFRREAFDPDDTAELFLDGLLKIEDAALPFVTLGAAPEGSFQGEGLIRRGDEEIPVLITSSQMQGRGRDERWLVVVLEDLREAKKLAAEQRRADSLQSMVEMSATLAHEIRNPLMGLSAQAELLADNLDDADPRRRYIDVITSEVDRINETITRMLQFVRPCEPRLDASDVERLLEDSAVLAAPRAEAKGVTFALDIDREARAWPCDASLLKQVALNLLFNAVDASPVGGEIEVTAKLRRSLEFEDGATGLRRRRPGLRIRVSDRGPGFGDTPPESLFRPFFTTKSTGTGLGLPICQKIVEAHGGNLRAERCGDATEFSVLLPAADARTRHEREERA
jgi:signal transduction histidine kinase/DNA-binding NarL/FixJ family response regulator